MCSDVVVLVGSCAAVAARVVVSDTPDDQITARQQRVLLIPTEGGRGRWMTFCFACLSDDNLLFFLNMKKLTLIVTG